MNEEIKEILEYMQEIIDCTFTTNTFELNFERVKLLLDYITNLQQENERLTESLEKQRHFYLCKISKIQQEKETLISTLKLRNEISSYLKNKIDKAIKYIKSTNCYGMRSGKTLLQKYLNNLLNILNGSDEK